MSNRGTCNTQRKSPADVQGKYPATCEGLALHRANIELTHFINMINTNKHEHIS